MDSAWRAKRMALTEAGSANGLVSNMVRAVALALTFLVGGVIAREGGLLSEEAVQRFVQRYGAQAQTRLDDWETLMQDHSSSAEQQKLRQVNDFFNQLPWLSDDEHWGKRDYWATPLEMMGTNGGDCEDFSVAKFITLVHMGVEPKKLRITYVRAPRLRQPHMVLAYYSTPNAQPLILDNLIPEIKPGAQRRDLIPVYSFNTSGLWATKADGGTRRLGASARLSAWRDVSRRMSEDGLDVNALKREKKQ